MSFWLPTGFDRADGVTPLPAQPDGASGADAVVGSPSPLSKIASATNAVDGITPTVEEAVDSPEIERAEQATSQHRIKASWLACIAFITVMGRGTFLRDSFGNLWRILSSKINPIRSGDGASKMGELSYTAESVSFDSPPDDYQDLPVELGLDILKHPRYSWALLPFDADNSAYYLVGDITISISDIKQTIIRIIQTYRDSPIYPSGDNVNGTFQSAVLSQIQTGILQIHYPNFAYDPAVETVPAVTWDGDTTNTPTDNCVYFLVGVTIDLSDNTDPLAIALAAAKEIISKLWRGEDTPYITGREITWSQYYFAPVYINPGGYIENPVGIVPDYFMSPAQDGSNTIFDNFTYYNPQCYSAERKFNRSLRISWLRKADEVEYQRTWFKVTRKWIGSPIGSWDLDLYSGNEGPFFSTDFNLSINQSV